MKYSQKTDLILPEYGRNIQQMVTHAVTIEDRSERTRCAKTIIDIMGNMFPYLRDVDGFKHKLWDHLAIMSEFKLDIDYPFEVEFMVNTGQTVNTLRSIQYIMEAYKYAKNCYDRFHVLDYNFDEAIIHNTEQVSGLLKLNLNPKDNPTAILGYPVIGVTDIQILFSKEENKYRFNQFWDVTDDRGEFFNPAIPGFAQRPIWNTEDNGYIRLLNPINLNYAKNPFQRKKFRHYTTSVWLCKKVSGDKKMLVMIADTKELYSPR